MQKTIEIFRDLNYSKMQDFLIRYFVLINMVTFILWGIDKWKANNKKRRIKEKTLLICSGIGGWIGAVLGMELFRHKTVKGKFLIWFWSIVAARIVGIFLILLYK